MYIGMFFVMYVHKHMQTKQQDNIKYESSVSAHMSHIRIRNRCVTYLDLH